VQVVVVALAHTPETGEESLLFESAEAIGSSGLDDLTQTTKNGKQSDHRSLASLVIEHPAPLSTVFWR
jgi:hypothetical protein